VTSLQGLTIDAFFEESYRQLLLRNPEQLTASGLARAYGVRNDRLNDLSDAYLRETQELEIAILDMLRSYDRAQLDAQQRISCDVYEWYLDDRIRGHEFAYHNYPIHHFLGSYQDELVRLFTELHPLRDGADAEDYVTRLSQVNDQVDQLLLGLEKREDLGVIPPRFIVDLALPGLRALAHDDPHTSPLYTTFEEKLTALEEVDGATRQALLEAADLQVGESVLPAFQKLADYAQHLQSVTTEDAGVWKLPDGDAYYAYVLRHQTSTAMTPEEIHETGLSEVARIQAEMEEVFAGLGYPANESLGARMERAMTDGGLYNVASQAGKDEVIRANEALLAGIDQKLGAVVDLHPRAPLVVIGDLDSGGGGYYVQASLDGSRPGAFHTGVGGTWVPKFNMATIAYHEGIPGHHFQIAIAQELDLPTFRNDLFFNGFGEGWALYAEQLAWELGMYEDDPYGNLGRLQLELLRAVRLVADTGIHAMGWTRDEARAYMNEAMGDPAGRWSHEVDRYIAWPAQATGYKVGMLKILELRQRAMDQLGDQFDLKSFHNVVLGSGSMPLEILDQVVQAYISQN
jgi:uncharacterized protein (DUF885 family)